MESNIFILSVCFCADFSNLDIAECLRLINLNQHFEHTVREYTVPFVSLDNVIPKYGAGSFTQIPHSISDIEVQNVCHISPHNLNRQFSLSW